MPTIEFNNSKGKPVEAPCVPASVADTHAHLDMIDDPGLALARCAASHLDFVTCVVDPSENTRAYAEVDGWLEDARGRFAKWQHEGITATDGREAAELKVPRMRMLCGVHPHNAKLFTPECEARLVRHAADSRTAGIGEIGLDYHYDLSPRSLQRDVFARQIALAHEMGLPIALHIREAHAEAIDILGVEGVPEAGCVLHCFNLDYDALRPFLDLGCYVAFGGPLTFKKSHATREAATQVPLDRLLTETDAPYMAPEPLRGTSCSPEDTIFTAQRLFEVYADAHAECEDATVFYQTLFDNALRVFDQSTSLWQNDSELQKVLLDAASGCISAEESAYLCNTYTDEEG